MSDSDPIGEGGVLAINLISVLWEILVDSLCFFQVEMALTKENMIYVSAHNLNHHFDASPLSCASVPLNMAH